MSNLLKRVLVLFWAVWFTVVLATNLCDAAKAMDVLEASGTFASGNYALVVQTTARYGPPAWLNGLLFAGVIAWEGLAALLFWLALGKRSFLYAAFTAGLGLWAAFMVADEVFIAYPIEATHMRLFIAQLASLLAIELLPDGDCHRRS